MMGMFCTNTQVYKTLSHLWFIFYCCFFGWMGYVYCELLRGDTDRVVSFHKHSLVSFRPKVHWINKQISVSLNYFVLYCDI